MIVSFLGIDGSGKSTVACRTADIIENHNGYQCRVLWSRVGYTPIFSGVKKIIRSLFLGNLPKPGPNKQRTKLLQNPMIARLWLAIAICDLILYWGILLRYNSMRGRVVICDRYITDTYLDLKLNFPHIDIDKNFFWKTLILLLPAASKSFLFNVDTEVAFMRCKNKYDPFPTTFDFMLWRSNQYPKIGSMLEGPIVSINANLGLEEVTQQVTQQLHQILNPKGIGS